MIDLLEDARRNPKYYLGEKEAVAQWELYAQERQRDLKRNEQMSADEALTPKDLTQVERAVERLNKTMDDFEANGAKRGCECLHCITCRRLEAFPEAVKALGELYAWCEGLNDFRQDSRLARKIRDILAVHGVAR